LAETIAVIGLGEVGRPLYELVEQSGHDVVGVDVSPTMLPTPGNVSVMHVCIPFEVEDFVAETIRYIELLRPGLTIINSTVAVGTTRAVYERARLPIAHSPVRGKHSRMLQELTHYDKFVGPIDVATGAASRTHLETLGMTTRIMSSPEATELAKLTETTYFAVLVAWAQEVERYCDAADVDYDDVVSIYEEIGYLPESKFFPGVIGGHCLMPNIEILREIGDSPILEAIRWSNRQKVERDDATMPDKTH
jgi:UDP-N-acetyl-D-mannosaminuronate dehydrogenase